MTNHPIYYNPWPGITSYEDPATSKNKLDFCGRDNDIYDMTRLIDDNLVVVLYGKSGIGKTSLLNAGVFPALRKEQYVPVSIRLGSLDESASFQNAITSTIENAIAAIGGTFKVVNVVEEKSGDQLQASDYLWNYFARHRFFNSDGQTVFPVIVLDQFEEVLRYADKESQTKADALLTQIHYLADESHALNDCRIDGEKYYYDFNFRFVISIREDELYLLEDNIDKLSVGAFKRCRYRLRSISQEGALAAILIPGRDCIHESQKEAIAQQIIKLSTRKVNDEIDTLLLSLVCAGTYGKKAGEKITLTDLAVWDDNPMEVYYQDAIKGLAAEKVRYIQQYLIREDGSRRRVDANEVRAALGEGIYNALIQGENRMLSLGEHGQVELLHDQLALAVYEERKAFEERERKKKLRRRVTFVGIVVLAITGVFLFQNHRLKQQQWKMMENQSRYIAEKANNFLEKSDPFTAKRLLLDVLPTKNNDKPCTSEAEKAFRNACNLNTILFKGHDAIVSSVSFSPNGAHIASASWDGTVRIWDAQTGEEIRVFNGHSNWVNSVSFRFDGKRIVSASDDKTVRIWDTETGNCVRTLKGHTSGVNSVSYSPSGKLIVSTSNDTTVRIWNAETGHVLRILRCYPEIEHVASMSYDSTTRTGWNVGCEYNVLNCGVYSAAFSPNEKYVVSDFINNIIIWDAATGKKIKILKGHTGQINSLSFSPDGKHIVSSSDDKTVKIWDTETGNCILTYEGHDHGVTSAVFSPDGRSVVSASSSDGIGVYNGIIILWDVNTGEEIQTIERRQYYDHSLSFSPDGKSIASAFFKTISVWKVATGSDFCFQEEKPAEFYAAAFSPDGKHIVYTSSEKTVKIMEVKTGQIVRTLDGHSSEVYSATFSANGKFIVTASNDSTIKIWEVKTGNCIRTLNGHKDAVLSASFSPDGKRIVSASADSTIRIWDAESGKELIKLKGHSGMVYSATFSPDGRRIVSRSEDRTTKVWEAKTGSEIVSFEGPDDCYSFGESYSAAFTLNGECVIAPSNNNQTVNIRNIKTGKIIHTLKGNIWWVNPVVNTSEGERVVTTYLETVKVWDSETGVEIQSFQNNSQESYAIFSPNGKQILVNDDGTFRIWDFPPLQELIDQTRERFKDRPLTPEERRMYYLE